MSVEPPSFNILADLGFDGSAQANTSGLDHRLRKRVRQHAAEHFLAEPPGRRGHGVGQHPFKGHAEISGLEFLRLLGDLSVELRLRRRPEDAWRVGKQSSDNLQISVQCASSLDALQDGNDLLRADADGIQPIDKLVQADLATDHGEAGIFLLNLNIGGRHDHRLPRS